MYGPRFRLLPTLGIILIVLLLTSMVFADMRIKKSLVTLASAEVQTTGAEAISRVINDKVVSGLEYDDIVAVHKDGQGRVVLIQPNTLRLNKVMSSTVIEVSKFLGQMKDNTIEIPMGEMSGIDLLAAQGPRMKVKVIPAGQVYVNVLNEFQQAGINQTRHLIYFEVRTNIKVAVPFMENEVEVVAVIPMTETIIVGDVPETYVNFLGSSEMMYPFISGK